MSYEVIDIKFAQGMGQKVDQRIAPAGVLSDARDVWQDKQGTFRKRRGFVSKPLDDALGLSIAYSATQDDDFRSAAIYEGELVLFGSRTYHAVPSLSHAMPTTTGTVLRGWLPRGNLSRQDVVGSLADINQGV